MSWDSWGDYRPRIRPANGIRARTPRGKFGETWWAGRWIAALERLTNEGRLARGRTYARGGQVVKLDVGTEGVAAEVQGSMPKPYKVSIRFRRLSDAEWDRVVDAMAAQAIYAAKLLSGEMPEQIEDLFAQVGTSVLPAEAKDLVTNCSCPDWSNPCKHVAAVYYLLGERFDDDPFLMFELRGRSEDALLTALRARRGISAAGSAAEIEQEAAPVPAEPLPADPALFWTEAGGGATPLFSFEAPAVDALAVKRLGSPPFLQGSKEFQPLMEQLYHAIGEYAYDLATGSAEVSKLDTPAR
jgi:uncharacterized Zn finger protein